MTNTTPTNASAVEELREKFKKFYFDESTHKDFVTIADFFLNDSTLTDSTLREVLEEVGEDGEYGEHVFHPEYENDCHDVDIVNQERQRIRDIIIKRLEK